jgi:hypothetical protein
VSESISKTPSAQAIRMLAIEFFCVIINNLTRTF